MNLEISLSGIQVTSLEFWICHKKYIMHFLIGKIKFPTWKFQKIIQLVVILDGLTKLLLLRFFLVNVKMIFHSPNLLLLISIMANKGRRFVKNWAMTEKSLVRLF